MPAATITQSRTREAPANSSGSRVRTSAATSIGIGVAVGVGVTVGVAVGGGVAVGSCVVVGDGVAVGGAAVGVAEGTAVFVGSSTVAGRFRLAAPRCRLWRAALCPGQGCSGRLNCLADQPGRVGYHARLRQRQFDGDRRGRAGRKRGSLCRRWPLPAWRLQYAGVSVGTGVLLAVAVGSTV